MFSLRLHVLLVFIFVGVIHASPKLNDVHDKNDNCAPSLQNQVFNEANAVGLWHTQQSKSKKTDAFGNSDCVLLSSISEQERNDLKEMIGKYVDKLKWENLTLRMQIPCPNTKSNNTKEYYLERLEGDGFYRTLNIPPSTTKLEFGVFRRYPIRLKIIENEYLGIMDCHMFLLGRDQFDDTNTNERVQKIHQLYWPDEI